MAEPTRTLSQAEEIDRLRLIRSENIGPMTFSRLLAHFGTAAAALDALPEMARRGGRRKPIRVCPRAAAEREYAAIADLGASLVCLGEAGYPAPLAAIADAPPVLTIRGHPHLLQRNAMAIVGARNASANGCRMAREIAAELAMNGVAVVSGMARGIDAAAHQGALDGGTVAAVAGGADVIYPPENGELYRQVLDRGVILSEVALGTEPRARHFPRRNRLISGLSLGVLVVEAAQRSGSLITARLALEQGREVFAVPGSPLDPRCRGANGLLRQGAVVTENAKDILDILGDMLRRPLAEARRPAIAAPARPPAEEAVDRDRALVIEKLSPSPVSVDEIIRQCQTTAPVVSAVLLELELAGRLERHHGNRVSLVNW